MSVVKVWGPYAPVVAGVELSWKMLKYPYKPSLGQQKISSGEFLSIRLSKTELNSYYKQQSLITATDEKQSSMIRQYDSDFPCC